MPDESMQRLITEWTTGVENKDDGEQIAALMRCVQRLATEIDALREDLVRIRTADNVN